MDRTGWSKYLKQAPNTPEPVSNHSCGVIFNAFRREKDVVRASSTARRMKAAFQLEHTLGVCQSFQTTLFIDKPLFQEVAPELLSSFDSVLFYEDDAACFASPVPAHRPKFYLSPKVWLVRMCAAKRSPYAFTLFQDNDASPCTGVGAVFQGMRSVDVKGVEDGFGGSRGDPVNPFPSSLFASSQQAAAHRTWTRTPEVNMGFVLMATYRKVVKELIQEYLHTYLVQVNDPAMRIFHDQAAFRQALFSFRNKLVFQPLEKAQICRPYERELRDLLKEKHCAGTSCLVMHCHECEGYL